MVECGVCLRRFNTQKSLKVHYYRAHSVSDGITTSNPVNNIRALPTKRPDTISTRYLMSESWEQHRSTEPAKEETDLEKIIVLFVHIVTEK